MINYRAIQDPSEPPGVEAAGQGEGSVASPVVNHDLVACSIVGLYEDGMVGRCRLGLGRGAVEANPPAETAREARATAAAPTRVGNFMSQVLRVVWELRLLSRQETSALQIHCPSLRGSVVSDDAGLLGASGPEMRSRRVVMFSSIPPRAKPLVDQNEQIPLAGPLSSPAPPDSKGPPSYYRPVRRRTSHRYALPSVAASAGALSTTTGPDSHPFRRVLPGLVEVRPVGHNLGTQPENRVDLGRDHSLGHAWWTLPKGPGRPGDGKAVASGRGGDDSGWVRFAIGFSPGVPS